MRRLILAVAPLLIAAAPAPEPVDYLVTPQIGADGLERVVVTMQLRGDADGETEIVLPDEWAGTNELYTAVEGLTVDGGTLAATDNPATRLVRHAADAPITVRYGFGLSADDPAAEYAKARPVLRPGWFYIHGEGIFAAVAGREEAPARFRWGPAPAGWRLDSNLEPVEPGALTVERVADSILIGGPDLRAVEREVGGAPVRIVLRGEWPFEVSALADGLARALAAENGYFDAEPAPFLVTLIPLTGRESGAISYGGTARSNGFALASTTNVGLDLFLPLLAHEYGHRWFGRGLGPIPDPDAPEYWFTEGFNDFAASRAMVRAGLWSPADYAAHLNQVLLRYAQSPARTRTNADLAAHFWEDNAAMQMPYDRGHLFALLLEPRGDGLRQALLAMARRPESFPAAETEGQRLIRAASVPANELAAVLGGEPLALPADLFAPCGRVEWIEQPVYASGYTVEERPDGRYFETVDEASPAWTAGLRPGMRYVKRESFRYGDSSVPIVMRVADAAGERVLRWLPQGRETIRFQRLTIANDGEACRARLSGD